MIRPPLLTLGLLAAATAVHLVPGAAAALEFDRGRLGGGEPWRWVTAHLAHFDTDHFLWDALMLAAVGTVAETRSPVRYALALAAAALAIVPAIRFGQPDFSTYRGLSGLVTAAFALVAADLLHRPDRAARLLGSAAVFAVAAKCGYEIVSAGTIFAAGNGYVPVPLAHALGLLAGLAAAVRPAPRPAGPAPGQPLGRLVDEACLREGRRDEPPARFPRIDSGHRSTDS